MKIITPLVLLGLGVVLLALAVVLYPSAAAEARGPFVPLLAINASVPAQLIEYDVTRASSGRTNIEITIYLNSLGPVSRSRTVSVRLYRAVGSVFQQVTVGRSPYAQATVHFTVNVADFGMSLNGSTASVAIPSILYNGPGNPELVVTYPIPSASSYDWSSFPATSVNSSGAIWNVATTESASGQLATTPGQVAVGINHVRQASDSNKTFVAGALLGLAGAAILSAVQEALHARD